MNKKKKRKNKNAQIRPSAPGSESRRPDRLAKGMNEYNFHQKNALKRAS